MRLTGLLRGLMLGAVLAAGCSDDPDDDGALGGGAGAGTGAGAATGTGGRGSGGDDAGTGSGSGSAGSGSSSAAGAGTAGEAGGGPGSAGTGGAAGSGASGGGSGSSTGASGAACGSRGLGPCDDGELCSFPESASCGEADAPGTCETIPTGCTKELAPVCGCDGTTYGNRCNALAAGVSVRREGECGGGGSAGGGGEPTGDSCGGGASTLCPDGQYCDYARGPGCRVADAPGECADKPTFCTFESNPTCGCDGMTYGNPCAAAAAGVSVDHMGEY